MKTMYDDWNEGRKFKACWRYATEKFPLGSAMLGFVLGYLFVGWFL